jgi:hypothetical protein
MLHPDIEPAPIAERLLSPTFLFCRAPEIHGNHYCHFTTLGKGLVFTTSDFQRTLTEVIQLSRKIPLRFIKSESKLRKMG